MSNWSSRLHIYHKPIRRINRNANQQIALVSHWQWNHIIVSLITFNLVVFWPDCQRKSINFAGCLCTCARGETQARNCFRLGRFGCSTSVLHCYNRLSEVDFIITKPLAATFIFGLLMNFAFPSMRINHFRLFDWKSRKRKWIVDKESWNNVALYE